MTLGFIALNLVLNCRHQECPTIIMSHNPTLPPPYDGDPSLLPLLGSPKSQLAQVPSGGNGFYDQPAEEHLPDDFKYGTLVSESSPEIRKAFVRKVYTILCTLSIFTTNIIKVLTFFSPKFSRL